MFPRNSAKDFFMSAQRSFMVPYLPVKKTKSSPITLFSLTRICPVYQHPIDLFPNPPKLAFMGGGKYLRISIFALALLLATIAIVYVCIPKEPHYQGRSLSQWLYQAQSSFNYSGARSGSDPQWQSASNALQNIGTNALPLLLRCGSGRGLPAYPQLKERTNSFLTDTNRPLFK